MARRLTALLMGIALWGPAAVSAEPHQFGNIVYDLPDTWYLGRDDDGWQVLLSDYDDGPCEFCYIHLSESQDATGDLLGFSRANFLRFVDEDDQDGYEMFSGPELTSVAGIPVAMTLAQDSRDFQIVLTFDLGDRYEMVAFEGEGGDDTEASLQYFQTSILPMFEGLRFVSEGAPSLLPEPVPGGLSGVYWGWYQYTTFGLDGMTSLEIDFEVLVFYRNGTFYYGTPPLGVRPFDREALMRAADPNHGSYFENGNTVDLYFANGTREQLIRYGDGWEFDGTEVSLVQTPPDGSRLDGTIEWFFFSGFTPGIGLQGGVSGGGDTTFYPDGRYTGSSFGGAFGSFDTGGGFASNSGDESGGTYQIRDGLIIMTPSGGGTPTAELVIVFDDAVLVGDEYLQ